MLEYNLRDIVAIKREEIRQIEVRTGHFVKGELSYCDYYSPGVTHFAVYVPEDRSIHYLPVPEAKPHPPIFLDRA